MSRVQPVLLGAVAVLGVAELFHGPLGRAMVLKANIERRVNLALEVNEMTQVRAHLADTPMRRTIILSGPADAFQHRELLRLMTFVPGVAAAEWDPASPPVEAKLAPGPAPDNVLAPPVVRVPEGK